MRVLSIGSKFISEAWPLCPVSFCIGRSQRGRFCSSKRYRVEGNTGNRWEVLADSAPTSARPWTVHDLNHPAKLSGLRVVQPPGGGSLDHPNRLWLSEIECQ